MLPLSRPAPGARCSVKPVRKRPGVPPAASPVGLGADFMGRATPVGLADFDSICPAGQTLAGAAGTLFGCAVARAPGPTDAVPVHRRREAGTCQTGAPAPAGNQRTPDPWTQARQRMALHREIREGAGLRDLG